MRLETRSLMELWLQMLAKNIMIELEEWSDVWVI